MKSEKIMVNSNRMWSYLNNIFLDLLQNLPFPIKSCIYEIQSVFANIVFVFYYSFSKSWSWRIQFHNNPLPHVAKASVPPNGHLHGLLENPPNLAANRQKPEFFYSLSLEVTYHHPIGFTGQSYLMWKRIMQ